MNNAHVVMGVIILVLLLVIGWLVYAKVSSDNTVAQLTEFSNKLSADIEDYQRRLAELRVELTDLEGNNNRLAELNRELEAANQYARGKLRTIRDILAGAELLGGTAIQQLDAIISTVRQLREVVE